MHSFFRVYYVVGCLWVFSWALLIHAQLLYSRTATLEFIWAVKPQNWHIKLLTQLKALGVFLPSLVPLVYTEMHEHTQCLWCMRGSILNGILVCVCVCVWMSVWVEWRTERHNQPLPDFLLHIQQAGLWEACLCHLSADWCGQIPRYMRYKTHTHTHSLWVRHSSITLDEVWIHSPVYAYLSIFWK